MRRFNRFSGKDQKTNVKTNDTFTIDLANRPYRTLNQAKTLVQHINPGDQVADSPTPYKICTTSNRVRDGYYSGKMNDSGNLIDMLPNSAKSAMLDSFDIAHMELLLNYMYLAIDSDAPNTAANLQYGKSITEALSKVNSETFIDLPFFKDRYVSAMPTTGTARGYGEVLAWYQSMNANILLPIISYGKMLSFEHHMKMMGYNREAPIITELMGLFRKAAFKNYILTLNGYVKSQYLDVSWFKQINTIANGMCRLADDTRHPLLTMTCSINVPSIAAYHGDSQADPYFSSDSYKIGNKAFEKTINDLCSYFSPYNIVLWARRKMMGTLEQSEPQTAMEYYNAAKYAIENILSVLSKYPADTAEIRTMLDVAQRGNLNQWKQGVFIDVDSAVRTPVEFNKIIFDIYRSYMTTSYNCKWDHRTQRYTFKTPWNAVFGIPEYDRFNGGSFLTFSNYAIDTTGIPAGDLRLLVPIMYKIDPGFNQRAKIVFANRCGKEAIVNRLQVTLSDHVELTRLNLLKDDEFDKIFIPNVEVRSAFDFSNNEMSQLNYALTTVFDIAALSFNEEVGHEFDEDDIETLTVSHDLIGFIDVELADVTNDMIVYYQSYSPLKVYTQDGRLTIGFSERSDISFV